MNVIIKLWAGLNEINNVQIYQMMECTLNSYNELVPSSSIENIGIFLEDKAIFVTLTIGEDDIFVFIHHTLRRPGH